MEYKLLEEHLITPFKELCAVVFIFGSLANETFKKFSDIDLLYQETSGPISNAQIYHFLSFFEESTFPFKLDLVKDSELAKSYRESVDREKIKL